MTYDVSTGNITEKKIPSGNDEYTAPRVTGPRDHAGLPDLRPIAQQTGLI